LRQGAASLAGALDAHHLYTERATAREAALRAVAAGNRGEAGCLQPGLFDQRAVNQAAQQREAREHRRELHTARLAQIALEARVDERLSAEPILALVLR
jgi:hypothetical protein